MSKKFLSIVPLFLFVALLSSVGYLLFWRPGPNSSSPTSEVEVSPTVAAPSPEKTLNPTSTQGAAFMPPAATPSPVPTSTPPPTQTPTETLMPAPTHTLNPTPTNSPTATLTPIPTPEAVVLIDGVELRAGPGDNYDLIERLPQGDILDIQGRTDNGDWLQVIPLNPGQLGWVAAEPGVIEVNVALETILVVETPPPPTPTPSPLPPALTPTASPTPAPLLITSPPILLDPQPGASQYRNRIELEWDWPGTLGPDDYFQVEIRNRYNAGLPVIDDSVPPIDVAWVKDKFYKHDYVDEAYDREYTWRIIVVRGIPPGEKQWSLPEYRVWEPTSQFEQISEPSEMRTLYVEPGNEPPPNSGDGGKKGDGGNFRP